VGPTGVRDSDMPDDFTLEDQKLIDALNQTPLRSYQKQRLFDSRSDEAKMLGEIKKYAEAGVFPFDTADKIWEARYKTYPGTPSPGQKNVPGVGFELPPMPVPEALQNLQAGKRGIGSKVVATLPGLATAARLAPSAIGGEKGVKRLKEAAMEPLVDLTELVPEPTGPATAYIHEAAAGLSGFTSPLNVALMAGTGFLGNIAKGAAGKAIQVGLSTYFGSEAGQSLLASWPELKDAYNKSDWTKIGGLLGQDTISAIVLGGTAAHARGLGRERMPAYKPAPDPLANDPSGIKVTSGQLIEGPEKSQAQLTGPGMVSRGTSVEPVRGWQRIPPIPEPEFVEPRLLEAPPEPAPLPPEILKQLPGPAALTEEPGFESFGGVARRTRTFTGPPPSIDRSLVPELPPVEGAVPEPKPKPIRERPPSSAELGALTRDELQQRLLSARAYNRPAEALAVRSELATRTKGGKRGKPGRPPKAVVPEIPKPELALQFTPRASEQTIEVTPEMRESIIKPSASLGRDITVQVPGETTRYQGQFAVREAGDVEPSHNPITFQPNERYLHRNARNYDDPRNQAGVIDKFLNPNFDYLYADVPTAEMGGPIWEEGTGNVLGGNDRSMVLKRLYEQRPEVAAAYKQGLIDRAAQYGLDPNQVAAMREPILGRELTGDFDRQRAIADFNKDSKKAYTGAESAIAESRYIADKTLGALQTAFLDAGPEQSLAEVLSSGRGMGILQGLTEDGALTPQQVAGLISDKQLLSEAGKKKISDLLMGGLFRNPDQMERTPWVIKAKLERVLAPAIQSSVRPEWNTLPVIQEALDILEEAKVRGTTNLGDLAKQQGLVPGGTYSNEALRMAEFLRMATKGEAGAAMSRYAHEEVLSRPGLTAALFEPRSQNQAFAEEFVSRRQAKGVAGEEGKSLPEPKSAPGDADEIPPFTMHGGLSGIGEMAETFWKKTEEDLKRFTTAIDKFSFVRRPKPEDADLTKKGILYNADPVGKDLSLLFMGFHSPSQAWGRVSPILGDIANLARDAQQRKDRNMGRSYYQSEVAFKRTPKHLRDKLIDLLDNPDVTPDNVAAHPNLTGMATKVQERVVKSYRELRNLTEDIRTRMVDARQRALLGQLPPMRRERLKQLLQDPAINLDNVRQSESVTSLGKETGEGLAKAYEDHKALENFGMKSGFWPHVFRGDWGVLVDGQAAAGIPAPPAKEGVFGSIRNAFGDNWDSGWLSSDFDTAVKKAERLVETNPDLKGKVSIKMVKPRFAQDDRVTLTRGAIRKLSRSLEKETGFDYDTAREVAYGVAKPRPQARFFGHAKRREANLPGWLKTEDALYQYVRGAERYIEMAPLRVAMENAREEVAKQVKSGDLGDRTLMRLDSWINRVEGRQGWVHRGLNDWFDKHGYPMGYDQLSRTATGMEAILKLGFSPVTAIVNLTQYPLNSLPVLGPKYAAIGMRDLAMGRNRHVLDQLGIAQASTKAEALPGGKIDWRNLDTEHVMDAIRIYFPETPKEWLQAPYKAFRDIAMYPFFATEYGTRAATALGAYAAAKGKLGVSDAQALKFASEVGARAMFRYGPEDTPWILASPVIGPAAQFKRFMLKQMEFTFNLARKDTPARLNTRASEVGLFILAAAGLLGVGGIPGGTTMDNMVEALTKRSSESFNWPEKPQRPIEQFQLEHPYASRGALGYLFDGDLSASVGFTDWMSSRSFAADQLKGPLLSDMTKLWDAWNANPGRERRQALRAFWRGASPEIRRLADAYGQSADSGEVLDFRDNPRLQDTTPKERFLLAMGVEPIRFSQERMQYTAALRGETQRRSERAGFVEQIAEAQDRDDYEGAHKIQMQAYEKGHRNIGDAVREYRRNKARPRLEQLRSRVPRGFRDQIPPLPTIEEWESRQQ